VESRGKLLKVGSLPAADLVGQALWTLDETRRRILAMPKGNLL